MGVAGGLLLVTVDGRVELGHLVSLALQCSKKRGQGGKYKQNVSHAAVGTWAAHGELAALAYNSSGWSNAGPYVVLLTEVHDGLGAGRKSWPWGEDTSSGALQEACCAAHGAEGHVCCSKNFGVRAKEMRSE
jgi:hypothetical protein